MTISSKTLTGGESGAGGCPAWCDGGASHSYTGEDFHHSGERQLGSVAIGLTQWHGKEVAVSVSVLDDEPMTVFDARLLSCALADPERAVAETAHCPAWCDHEDAHNIPNLDTDHMSKVRAVELSAYAEDEESMGYLALYLLQSAGEVEPFVLLDGPDDCAEARMTLAEAEQLHAALGETLATTRKAVARG